MAPQPAQLAFGLHLRGLRLCDGNTLAGQFVAALCHQRLQSAVALAQLVHAPPHQSGRDQRRCQQRDQPGHRPLPPVGWP